MFKCIKLIVQKKNVANKSEGGAWSDSDTLQETALNIKHKNGVKQSNKKKKSWIIIKDKLAFHKYQLYTGR